MFFMYKITLYGEDSKSVENSIRLYLSNALKNRFTITIPDSIFNLDENSDIYIIDLNKNNDDDTAFLYAKKIRKIYPFAIIILICSDIKYKSSYLDILPTAILKKPILREDFILLMKSILSVLNNSKINLLQIKTKNGLETIKLNIITFIEYENHYLYIHTKDGKIIKSSTIRTSFKSWMKPLLEFDHFISPHKSYLVNMDYVQKLMKNHTFIMNDEKIIPIASQTYTKIKNIYKNYIKNNYAITNS